MSTGTTGRVEGEVERLARERDAARRIISDARYLVEQDMADGAAMRATLAGNGLEPGVAAEYQSDLDRLRGERDRLAAALAEAEERALRAKTREVREQCDRVDDAIGTPKPRLRAVAR